MFAYHVHFSPREGVTREALVAQVEAFMETQLEGNRALGYRLIERTRNASYAQLPDFQLIVDYASEVDLDAAMATMQTCYREPPHAPLMSMVGTFRVAFSQDVLRVTG